MFIVIVRSVLFGKGKDVHGIEKFSVKTFGTATLIKTKNVPGRAPLLENRTTGSEEIASLDVFLEKAVHEGYSLHEIIQAITREVEKRIINRAYEEAGQNKKIAAQILRIDSSTLYRKMKGYSMRFPEGNS